MNDEQKDSQNRPSIVITMDDIQASKDAETSLTKEEKVHPFDKSEFIDIVEQELGADTAKSLTQATRPKVSNNPDELEQWESARIMKRKARIGTIETDVGYIARVFYEESFSVTQKPGAGAPQMMDMPGVTPGGLISHFYNTQVDRALKLEPVGSSLPEVIDEMNKRDPNMSRKFIEHIRHITYPKGSFRFNTRQGDLLVQKPHDSFYPEDFDSIGLRLINLMKKVPELFNEVKDQDLKDVYGILESQTVSKISLQHIAWVHAQVLVRGGSFSGANDERTIQALKKLISFRTHSEMQVFYKYLSPSGYINEKREE